MENPVMIFGAKGLGKVAQEIFNSRQILVYCFLDDDTTLHNTEINDILVMGATDDDGFLKYIGQRCEAFVAVTDLKERRALVDMLKNRRKVMPVNAIHDRAHVATSAFIGHGNLIDAGAVVNANSKVSNHCIVQANAVVEYEAELGDFAHIATGAIIGATAKIGEGAFIGTGAVIAAGVKVGANAQVAPGSVVLRNVAADTQVFGVPAKEI